MYLYKTYWGWENGFTEDECNKIVDLFKGIDLLPPKIHNNDDNYKTNSEKRSCEVGWLDETWVYERVIPFIENANILGKWNYQWDFLDNLQYTVYHKNSFYDWHTDVVGDGQAQLLTHPYPNKKELISKWGESKSGTVGKIRKLSFILLLNDPSEFEGGEVEIQTRNFNMNDIGKNPKDIVEINSILIKKGSLIVFPSDMWHRVLPVTKGVRISLVGWCYGYPFK